MKDIIVETPDDCFKFAADKLREISRKKYPKKEKSATKMTSKR